MQDRVSVRTTQRSGRRSECHGALYLLSAARSLAVAGARKAGGDDSGLGAVVRAERVADRDCVAVEAKRASARTVCLSFAAVGVSSAPVGPVLSPRVARGGNFRVRMAF